MIELKITKQDLSYITECLLFSCGCDVCAEWDKTDIENILNLAISLKKEFKEIDLCNIHIHNPLLSNGPIFVDSLTPEVINNFPEILKENLL
jgi:hypothetical protein